MIGHRADGRRVDLGRVDDRVDVWMVRDYPPPMPLIIRDGEPTTMPELRCLKIALHRTRIMYPDDWQGPLESNWELCDRDWLVARADYHAQLCYRYPPLSPGEIARLLNLRFPDDVEEERLRRSRTYPILGARPRGRVETCYVERGAPRFAEW